MREIFDSIPSASTEVVDDRLIGRVSLLASNDFGCPEEERIRSARNILVVRESLVKMVAAQMHCNSPCEHRLFQTGRGYSAYFSWNPNSCELIVEWGEIDNNSTAKLHDYLNASVDYSRRVKSGMIVRSGHLTVGHVNNESVGISLIDSVVSQRPLTPESPEYPMVEILAKHGILTISSDGKVINLRR